MEGIAVDDPLISEVLERLDADATKTDATETGEAENLVLGALLGRLDDVIDGVVAERPVAATRAESAPVRAYLESVAVTGFRGIGPTCQLGLRPGPGLTLVVGRNGSGKSSIAEALEFALTGDSLRWAGKSMDWKNGWRNLHAQNDPAITVGLRVDGEREPRTVRVNWSSRKLESAKTAVTVPGRGRQSLGSLGWSDAVRTFRPFLPYKELSTISEGRPIDRYNALAPMLGMETLQAPIENLRQARLSAERERTEAVEHVTSVTGLLRGSPDERASTAMEALSGAWDLDKIEALVTGTDPALAEREGLLAALEQLPSTDLDHTVRTVRSVSAIPPHWPTCRSRAASPAGGSTGAHDQPTTHPIAPRRRTDPRRPHTPTGPSEEQTLWPQPLRGGSEDELRSLCSEHLVGIDGLDSDPYARIGDLDLLW